MIFSVVPKAFEGELREQLEARYVDEANVSVIVDRREGERRDPATAPGGLRELRDRRRRRPGHILPLVNDEA